MTETPTPSGVSPIDDPTSVRAAGADRRSRQTRGQARRDHVVTETLALLAERGFRGSSISEIASRVGMTHPGLLYYFGSKERLLFEVVAVREAEEREAYAQGISAGLRPALPNLLRGIARLNSDSSQHVRLYVVLGAENLDPDAPLHDFFVNRYEWGRGIMRRALRADIADGFLRDDVDLEQTSREVLAMLMGLEAQWLMDPDAIDYVAAVDAYAQGLMERLAPPSA